MKIVFGLFILFILSNECKQQHSQASNLVQENIIISYEASTRGFYERTWVTRDSVSFSTDRNLNDIVRSKCKIEDWDVLISLLDEIDVKSLSKLEAPTKMHQVDGAAMATLTVEINSETFETTIFDHGHPPKVISSLVKKVLSMKEMMTKQ